MFAGLNGAFLLGNPAPTSAYPQTDTGFRKQHTDFEPVYQYDEELWEAAFNYDFDKFSVNISGGYQTTDYLSQQDYNVDVGFNMAPGSGPTNYPTSRPAGKVSDDWTSPACSFDGCTSGIFGGCIFPTRRETAASRMTRQTPKRVTGPVEAKVNTHLRRQAELPARRQLFRR